jgi:hypothetical protein
MRRAPLGLLCVLLVALPPAAAQEEEPRPVEWSFGGEIRIRPEGRDDADLDSGSDDRTDQIFNRIRLNLQAAVKDEFRVFIQAQDSRVWGEEASTASDEEKLDLHQGYLEVQKLGLAGLSFSAGRQEWTYGDHRLIGNFGWNNVGRSFDGGRIRWKRDGFTLDGLYAEISNRTLAGATRGSDLYGLYYQARPRAGAEYEAYYLGFSDRIKDPLKPGESGAPGATQVNAFGGRVKERFGPVDLTAEAALERGEVNGDDLSAGAVAFQAGWSSDTPTVVRAFGGYDYATGDADSTDGDQDEFFNFFPTNHPLYGYMDYFGWRNLESPHAGVSFAFSKHFFQGKGHDFSLNQAGGRWSDAAGNTLGFDPTGSSGTKVGRELDLTYRFDWRPNAKVEVGLSRFWPARFAKATRGDDASDWGYVQLTWGF